MQKIRDMDTSKVFDTFPSIYKNTSPVTEANMASLRLEFFEWEPAPPNHTDFNSACALFRSVCSQIESALELSESFTGGFDEIFALTDEQRTALRDAGLIDYLNFADRWCNHEANKIGLQAPAWWYKCWEDQ